MRRALMLKYRGTQLIRAGFIGVVLVVLVIAVGLAPERLVSWATALRYQALFAEAGGLAAGNDVTISGIKVGTVSDVAAGRQRPGDVHRRRHGAARLGDHRPHPHRNAAGRAGADPGVRGRAARCARRTSSRCRAPSSPYSLTEAVSELTTNTAGTDTASLNQSLDTLSATLDQIAPQLGPTFDGVTRLSQAINGRNDTLGELLKNGADVTEILSDRSQQVNTLILNANDLMAVLAERRYAIVELLAHTSALSKQLSGLIADNEQELAPTLDKLNSVTAMLEKNRDNIAKALPGWRSSRPRSVRRSATARTTRRTSPISTSAQILQPFLDYAFGFRRGVNAGQPPDNAGPRAEIPFPYNGIPGPGSSGERRRHECQTSSEAGARGGAGRRCSSAASPSSLRRPSSGRQRSPRTSPPPPRSIPVTRSGSPG